MRAVRTGVVMPPARMEYSYGVLRNSPISVNDRALTVLIRMPDRRTS